MSFCGLMNLVSYRSSDGFCCLPGRRMGAHLYLWLLNFFFIISPPFYQNFFTLLPGQMDTLILAAAFFLLIPKTPIRTKVSFRQFGGNKEIKPIWYKFPSQKKQTKIPLAKGPKVSKVKSIESTKGQNFIIPWLRGRELSGFVFHHRRMEIRKWNGIQCPANLCSHSSILSWQRQVLPHPPSPLGALQYERVVLARQNLSISDTRCHGGT